VVPLRSQVGLTPASAREVGAALLKAGQFGRGWLCRLGLLVAAVVVALLVLFAVEGEVVVEVAVAFEGAEPEDGLGAVEAPPGACDLHAVLDEPARGALDEAAGDGPAGVEEGV
jgi:hypothetical protein